MKVEFDPAKNDANVRKHGVSLADGDGVLLDPLALTIEESSADGELRWVTIGVNSLGSLMVIVWTQRREATRLISARRATRAERRAYEEGI